MFCDNFFNIRWIVNRSKMSPCTVLFVTVSVLCLTFTERAFAAENAASNLREENRHKKWVSLVILKHIYDYSITSETNPECEHHFEIYKRYFSNFTTWAVQMFDSSDLVPRGFLVGDQYKLGNFEECINAEVPKELGFSAQYCLPAFQFHPPASDKSPQSPNKWEHPVWDRLQTSNDPTLAPKNRFNLAFCIPSTCSSEDLQISLQNLLERPMKNAAYHLNVTVNGLLCTIKESSPPESLGTITMRYYIIGVTSFLLFCSGVDLLLPVVRGNKFDPSKAPAGIEKWTMPFSILPNMRLLMTPSTSPNDYKILHGIKTILMFVFIVGHHTLMGCRHAALVNWNYYEERLYDFSMLYVAPIATDFFFCMSGFLLCHSMVKKLEKNKLCVLTHIVNKVFRVFPPYFFVMAYTIYILPHLETGPLWKTMVETEIDYCRKGWWSHLFFVNNYLPGNLCFSHTYYIAADMHFFIVGSIIVLLCWRWKSYKAAILGSAFFLSFILPFFTVAYNQYEGLMYLHYNGLVTPRSENAIQHVYQKSHCRFGGFITGIIGAFLLEHLQKKEFKFSKALSMAGVLISVSTIVATACVRCFLHKRTTTYSVIQHALYAGLSAQIPCIGFMIVIIMQIMAGFSVLDILAHDLFVPFGRLSYWAYQLNIQILLVLIASQKTPMHIAFDKLTLRGDHWGCVPLTFIIAIYCYLIVDVPMNHMRSLILKLTNKIWLLSTKKKQ